MYWWFAKWTHDGTLARLHDLLRDQVRTSAGRAATPSAATIDSQSVRAADTVPRSSRGWDAGKKFNGRKRHLAPVIAYLRAEQALGRVAADADPGAAALLLLGACEQYAFVELMTGPEVLPFRDRPDPAAELVATLLGGLSPTPPGPTDTERP